MVVKFGQFAAPCLANLHTKEWTAYDFGERF
jgi:hypothetical protein